MEVIEIKLTLYIIPLKHLNYRQIKNIIHMIVIKKIKQ